MREKQSVCEQNSKKRPRDEEGLHEAAVWWVGGTETENCIACLVISLPPGSYSSPPLTVQLAPHLWYLFLPASVLPLWPSPHPSSLPLTTSLCHFAVPLSPLLLHFLDGYLLLLCCLSHPFIPTSAAAFHFFSFSCADLALASLLS